METLTIRNFRCFSDPGEIELKPITILIGENSAGKSSFLSAIRLAWDLANSARRLDFNEDPFLLGGFDQIAHFRGGRAGRARSFEIGSSATLKRGPHQLEGRGGVAPVYRGAEFVRAGSHPVIRKQVLRCGDYSVVTELHPDRDKSRVEIQVRGQKISYSLTERDLRLWQVSEAPVDLFRMVRYLHEAPRHRAKTAPAGTPGFTAQELDEIENLLFSVHRLRSPRPVAIAPVRTRPQRTYNPIGETPLPEGEHVPMVLARTYFEHKERWSVLKAAIDRFGAESGLFNSLDIRPLGKHESDPFQIHVKMGGPAANLLDVGYGVSQVLPILVDALLADRGDLYLLQQPEVHLHPRAQAALGSFVIRLAADEKKRFVIETHSDHFIDRIRMEVRDKQSIKPRDVSLLYFSRTGVEVRIHPMTIDDNGNLLDAPSDYRRFFLEEENRFLGG